MKKFSNLILLFTIVNLGLAVVFFNRASTNQTIGYKWLQLESGRKALENELQQITLDLSDSKALANIYRESVHMDLNQFDQSEFYSNLNDIAYVE